MTYDQVHTIRFFFRRSHNAEFGIPGRKSTLLILSAALLSRLASGQVPTVTALPYLLTDQAGVIRIVTSPSVVAVPPAVSLSGFGSLLGGGFGSLLSTPTASAAAAAATASIRKLVMLKNVNAAQKNVQQWQQNANQAIDNRRATLSSGCDDEFSAVKLNQGLTAVMKFNHQFVTADSPGCTLPEEQQAQEAEEELQTLTESEEASQEAIEAAEAAAEAAESAAAAAETAAEAALDGIDVLEGLLDSLALF